MQILAFLAISILAAGCMTSKGSTSGDGCHALNDAGTAYTPGAVECASTACAVGLCFACAGAMPGPFEQQCGTPAPAASCFAIACDGPEDCAPGEHCWSFESRMCSSGPPAGGFVRVCHTDQDCECSEQCRDGTCG